MATIYTHIESNNWKTFFLIVLFIFLVVGLGWLFAYWLNEPLILIIAIFIAVFQTFTGFFWSDKIILSLTRAQPLKKEDSPSIYNLVENLCLTAGLPMPKIYILPEKQPNAFATGRDKNHASIALTQGLIEKLNRTELEGVIAHELSHIGNKDILLQSIVVVLVSLIILLSHFFLRISFFRPIGRRGRGESGGIIFFLIFLAGIIAAILAPLAASLLKAAISRKREFLADATAALLTRYPEGLAGALEKISLDPEPMRYAREATFHLYIKNPLPKDKVNWFAKLFATHPPIEERIKRL